MNSRITNQSFQLGHFGEIHAVSLAAAPKKISEGLPAYEGARYWRIQAKGDGVSWGVCDAAPEAASIFEMTQGAEMILPDADFKRLYCAGENGSVCVQPMKELA